MDLGPQFLAVLLVLGMLWGALWILKKKGFVQSTLRRTAGRPGEPRLEVIDRLSLTPQHSVHLIRLADRVLLVGLSPGGCNLLETTPAANPAQSGHSA